VNLLINAILSVIVHQNSRDQSIKLAI